MASIQIIQPLVAGVVKDDGTIVASGTVTFYQSGTTTLKTVYQDTALTSPHTNPATLNSAGILVAYTDVAVKLVIVDSSGNAVRTINNVTISNLFETTSLEASAIVLGDGSGVDPGALGVPLLGQGAGTDPIYAKVDTIGITDDAITAAKIASGAVDSDELATDSVITTKILDANVTTAKIADLNVTRAKLESLGQQVSSSSGSFSTTSGADVQITNLSISITTTGRPVFVGLIPDGGVSASFIGIGGSANVFQGEFKIKRAGSSIARYALNLAMTVSVDKFTIYYMPGTLYTVDLAPIGTHTYTAHVDLAFGTTILAQNLKLVAYEF